MPKLGIYMPNMGTKAKSRVSRAAQRVGQWPPSSMSWRHRGGEPDRQGVCSWCSSQVQARRELAQESRACASRPWSQHRDRTFRELGGRDRSSTPRRVYRRRPDPRYARPRLREHPRVPAGHASWYLGTAAFAANVRCCPPTDAVGSQARCRRADKWISYVQPEHAAPGNDAAFPGWEAQGRSSVDPGAAPVAPSRRA